MNEQFSRVYCTITLTNEKLIYWKMATTFQPTASVSFYVDKARSGGVWENIGGPLVDACAYTDAAKWNWGLDKNTFYRIRYQSGADWIYSNPVQATGEWDIRNYKLVHEICRKERMVARLSGMPGVLMKRREWGTACTCLDSDTRQPTRHDCPLCYGVGIIGGYYAPIQLSLLPGQPKKVQRNMTEIGQSQRDTMMARCVAYPYIEAEDVWLGQNDNDRWRIVQATPTADLRGIPVIYNLQMGLLPKTDIVHLAAFGTKADTPPVAATTGTEYIWACSEEDAYPFDFILDGGAPDTDFDGELVDGGTPDTDFGGQEPYDGGTP